MNNSYKIVLIALIDLLKEQGMKAAGQVEGLNAYQALLEAKAQADALGLPLDEIGLSDFDFDEMLNEKKEPHEVSIMAAPNRSHYPPTLNSAAATL